MRDPESGCWGEKDDVSENPDEDCWSMAVDFDNEDIAPKSGSLLQAFMDFAVSKIDTGQNLQHCAQVFRTLCGFCWKAVRSMLGYKEGF
jgi:hypothetical protein